MDWDERFRVLKCELELANARKIRPTLFIKFAYVSWLGRLLLSAKQREIRKSAASIERALKSCLPKPATTEDHKLWTKNRSKKEIYADINTIPNSHSELKISDLPDLSNFEVRQLWYRKADRYEGRDYPDFFISRMTVAPT